MTTAAAPSSTRRVAQPPPVERYSALGWLQKNLFSNWLNVLLTLLSIGLLYVVVPPVIRWLFTTDFSVIPANYRLLMKGRYPNDEVGRLWICLYILGGIVGLSWGVWMKRWQPAFFVTMAIPFLMMLVPFHTVSTRLNWMVVEVWAIGGFLLGRFGPQNVRRWTVWLWVILIPLLLLIIGGEPVRLPEIIQGLGGPAWLRSLLEVVAAFVAAFFSILPLPEPIDPNLWGGLMLSLILSTIGIVFSFPLGVLLALGRQSRLPAIRMLCVIYIEFIRGVPLITLLFMMIVMLPLFLGNASLNINNVIRVLVAITLFSAAYTAENVRGGLQSIPNGQYEAAHALGLSRRQALTYIILPQALRSVIPVLVGQFIGLFKDTTLVALVGLFDLIGIARTILANPDWIGNHQQVFVFVGAVFWVFTYSMSYASRKLEQTLGVGER